MKPRCVWLAAALLLLVAPVAGAQSAGQVPVLNPVEQLNFDRPESWALKYFDSAMLLSGLDTPGARTPASVSIGFEIGWLPSLSASQRTVGFDGTKTEDLNKAPFLPRPRVVVGLPDRFSLIVAGDPPIRAFGIKPKLLAVGLERPVYEASNLVVGVRGYGQVGSVEAAFTCPTSVLGLAPGSPANAYGCRAESSDTASLRYVGGEVSAAYRGHRLGRLSPHIAVGVNYLNMIFQVNALRRDAGTTFDYLDRTRELAHGVTASLSGGVSYPLTNRLSAAADVFYTPLSVVRPPSTLDRHDGLFNVRALIAYRVK